MYGLNALAFVLFLWISFLAYRLSICSERTRNRVTRLMCFVLLAGNILRYALLYPLLGKGIRIPVEFSTVAYFIVPAIILTGRKSMRCWAAYSGIMAGFFYYIAMVVAGGPVYGSDSPYYVYISLLCHGTLYLCGLVIIGTELFRPEDGYKLAVGVACVTLSALLWRPVIEGSEKLLIYALLDGACVKLLLPQSSWCVSLPVYYALTVFLIMLSIKGFYKGNQARYDKFASMCDKTSIQAVA